MTEAKDQKDKKHPFKYRLRVKDGQVVTVNEEGEEVVYDRGSVFLSQRPYHIRFPEKYELVAEGTPLSQPSGKVLPEGYDPDFDEEVAYGPSGPVPTVPQPKPIEEPKEAHKSHPSHTPPKK